MLRTLWLPVLAVLGAAALGAVVHLVGVEVVQPSWRGRVRVTATVAAALTAGGLAVLARRAPRLAADAGAVAAGMLLAGLGAAALHGTRWGWFGLFSDSAFRTQMATRYADHLALVDYTYRDLPAFYPPAVGWLQGRLAALTGLSGWEAVKPVQLLATAIVPVLAYLLWRHVVGSPLAVAVAGLTAAWTIHPQKPDEWLVLACLVPWWLLTVRDVRAPGMDRWPVWRLGVVLGLLLLTHTYYFLPLGVATLLALGYDVLRRRTRLPWRRALAIGAVGLLVASPYWVGAVLARLRLPSDNLQLRYAYPGSMVPEVPVPLPENLPGAVEAIGVAWLVVAGVRWWRHRKHAGAGGVDELAGAIAFALVGSLLVLATGAVAMRLDVGLLAFKTTDLVRALLLVSGVLGTARLLEKLPRDSGRRTTAVAVAAAVAAGIAGHHVSSVWATGPPALVAQTTRYPDGSKPHGAPGEEPYYSTLFVAPTDPPVTAVREAWRSLRPDTPLDEAVVVTTRVDLLATTPVYGFVAFKSIYSHPNGQFEGRVDLLEQVASCPAPACAAELLRDNEYDAVDGLVLVRDGDRLVLPLMVDDFPHQTRFESVTFPSELFRGPEFDRRDLGSLAVVTLAR